MTLRELLALNLFLQAFDGTASYFIVTGGAPELNPLVGSVINSWGIGWGLLYCKLGCSIVLLTLYWLKRFRPTHTLRGLRFLALTYSAVATALSVELLKLFR
jgi:Domain of unknown function (DUF5658)